MGQFKIEIEGVGGHGDSRHIGDGGTLDPSDDSSYAGSQVDRLAFELVEALRAKGASLTEAKLTHWPGQPSEVVDDLLNKTRKGSF